jgi:hypothetical protein
VRWEHSVQLSAKTVFRGRGMPHVVGGGWWDLECFGGRTAV